MSHERPNTLRVSAKGIMRMLGEDPEFMVELQRCVIREVVRQLMPKDLNELVFKMIQAEVAASRAQIVEAGIAEQPMQEFANKRVQDVIRSIYHRNQKYTLTDAQQKQIIDSIGMGALALVGDTLNTKVDMIERELTRRANVVLGDVETTITALINGGIADGIENIVDRKVEERLAALKAAL